MEGDDIKKSHHVDSTHRYLIFEENHIHIHMTVRYASGHGTYCPDINDYVIMT